MTVALALATLVAFAVPASAQERKDSAQLHADSTKADTLRAASDTLHKAASDTTSADSTRTDTIFYNLPRPHGEVPSGWARGVWTWNAEQIQASGATTLAGLVEDLPGMVPLRGGDYGTPLAISAFGLGGGRVRVLRDGMDVLPLEGGVADLARIGLGGIVRVRLERNPGEIVIRMRSYEYHDGRPYSLVQAGTGDLNTSYLNGTYADPQVFGGGLALSLERSDTRGPRGNEPGSRNGSWVRYQLYHGNKAGLSADLRRMSNKTSLTDYPEKSTRTDYGLRGSIRLDSSVVAEAYASKSIYTVQTPDTLVYGREGGSVTQEGLLASFQRNALWARGAYRHFGGDGLPSSRIDLSLGADAHPGGFSAELDRAGWPGRSTSAKRLRAWTAPLFGILSAFGSWESGTYGARVGPLMAPPPPPDTTAGAQPLPASPADSLGTTFRVTDRTAYRMGLEARWHGFDLSWARLSEKADSLLPMGLVFDRAQPALPGGTRTGWEAIGTIPMPLHGLSLQGSLQKWNQPWSYLPKRIYRGAIVFHNTFMKTRDLEVWARIGVRGRDGMAVRQVQDQTTDSTGITTYSLATVPFYQDWYGLLQIRVVTVRVFIAWDNFALRQNLQDIPGRVLPATRAVYGVRWTMWN